MSTQSRLEFQERLNEALRLALHLESLFKQWGEALEKAHANK